MTASKEDYIKIIYKLSQTAHSIGNKAIAESLGVAAGSVTEMLRKLEIDGLIQYAPYKGISLTDKGIEAAKKLVTKHRLWEVFLVEKLGFDWSDVHEQAELLEHATDTMLALKLAQFLRHPKYCPHGWQIPYEGNAEELSGYLPLCSFLPGESLTLVRVQEKKPLLAYLSDMAIKIGDSFSIAALGEYQGDILLRFANFTKSVSYKAACSMYCKKTL